MATHSSILAWEIPRAEEPGRPQSMRAQRVGHDCMTNTFPLPCLLSLAFSVKVIIITIVITINNHKCIFNKIAMQSEFPPIEKQDP